MRRKAQKANARQDLAAPPLRATARIAAEAAPTGLVSTSDGSGVPASNFTPGCCRQGIADLRVCPTRI